MKLPIPPHPASPILPSPHPLIPPSTHPPLCPSVYLPLHKLSHGIHPLPKLSQRIPGRNIAQSILFWQDLQWYKFIHVFCSQQLLIVLPLRSDSPICLSFHRNFVLVDELRRLQLHHLSYAAVRILHWRRIQLIHLRIRDGTTATLGNRQDHHIISCTHENDPIHFTFTYMPSDVFFFLSKAVIQPISS